jgi:acyl dehydratase
MTVHDGRDRFGHYLEEFQPGDIYKHWPGITITEFMNTQFCLLTMNHMPLHIDKNWAGNSQHGQRIVVGTLVLSLAVGMSVPDTSGKTIANLEYEKVTHDGPVWIGDTIYAESEVLDKRESASKPDRGIVYIETRVMNQKGQKVMTFRRRFLAPKRSAAGAA